MRSSGIFSTLVLVALGVSPAFAQAPAAPAARPLADNRIPIAVVDARGVFARLGQDTLTATGVHVPLPELKSKALGLAGGAHVYPLRGKSLALGLGAEAILVRTSFEPLDAKTLKPGGTVYDRRLSGVSGQVSLNFGHRLGWSYLTVGLGPMAFQSYLDKLTPDGLSEKTLNYGGGARWFNFDHMAFTVDLRFYATKEALATPNTAARMSHKVFVMSAGIAIK